METAIDYLNRVHGDLLDAAKRERARVDPVPGPKGRVAWGTLAAASVAVLLVAGLIGSGVLRGTSDVGSVSRRAVGAGVGATGATGQVPAQETVPGLAPADVSEGGHVAGDVSPQDLTRVIRTAELSVTIPHDAFDERFGEAVDAAEEHGGFVADSSSSHRSGTLTLRVPAASFDETLRALRALGEVDVESVRGKDVTAEFVDLRARLRISKARLEVLLGLMQEATSIEQTIHVQNALDETQLRIEELQGQLRLLNDRTSLATIELQLREQGVEHEAEVETPSIPNAFERAVAGTVGVVAAIVIGLGYLLPLLALGLVGWLVVALIRRRRART